MKVFTTVVLSLALCGCATARVPPNLIGMDETRAMSALRGNGYEKVVRIVPQYVEGMIVPAKPPYLYAEHSIPAFPCNARQWVSATFDNGVVSKVDAGLAKDCAWP